MATPFISAQDLSDYLTRDVTSDPRTVIVIDAACEIVRNYLAQQVNLVTDDVVRVDGTGTYSLVLPELPVIEVTDVTVYDSTGLHPDVLVVNDDYIVGNSGVLWRLWCPWRYGKRNIMVTYTHGWDLVEQTFASGYSDPTPTVPTDIRMVALSVSKRLFEASTVPAVGIGGETIGNYSYTMQSAAAGMSPAALLVGETRILDQYRQRRVA